MADAPKIIPITIKPIVIKPVAPKPAAPAAVAPKPAAPAPAAAAPGGPAIKPIVISPRPAGANSLANANPGATIRLTPVAADGSPVAAPKPAPDSAPTVAIKPIAIKPKIAVPPQVEKPAAQTVQAMKGTTSRISLDSALAQPAAGGAPAAMGKITSNLTKVAAEEAKPAAAKTPGDADSAPTIRIKKPIVPAAHAAAPAPAAPAAEAGKPVVVKPLVKPAEPAPAPETAPADASEAPTVRKKSLVLKKPAGGPAAAPKSVLSLKKDDAAPKEGEKGGSVAVGSGPGGGLDDFEAPPSALSQGGVLQGATVRVKKTHWVFPVVGFLDVAALVAVIVLFMSQTCGRDRTLTDYTTYNKDGSPIVFGGSVQFRGR